MATGDEGLAADIKRQFGTEATKRFLRTLPAFRTEADIPDRFRELLDRLDGIEGSVAAGKRPIGDPGVRRARDAANDIARQLRTVILRDLCLAAAASPAYAS